MLRKTSFLRTGLPVCAVLLTLSACKPTQTVSSSTKSLLSSSATFASSSKSAAEALGEWVGDWQGVEGSYLKIRSVLQTYDHDGLSPSQKNEPVAVLISLNDMDASKVDEFNGEFNGETIAFTDKQGIKQVLRQVDGDNAHMNWLAGDIQCVSVEPMKAGFCRKDIDFDPDKTYAGDHDRTAPDYPWSGMWQSADGAEKLIIAPLAGSAPSPKYTLVVPAGAVRDGVRREVAITMQGRQVGAKLNYVTGEHTYGAYWFHAKGSHNGKTEDCIANIDGTERLCRVAEES